MRWFQFELDFFHPTGAIIYANDEPLDVCGTRWQRYCFFTKVCICQKTAATQADERRPLRGSEVEGLKHNCPESGPGQAG